MKHLMRRTGSIALLAALGACAPSSDGMASDVEAAMPAEVEHFFFTTTDDMRLHYAKLGDHGTPVILIHGSGGQAQTWLDNGIAATLAENHVVVAADMRGHGRSQGPRDGDMALDVIELMDHLGFQRAHIHGFSMGGSITGRLMARIPERIITAAFGGSGVREDPDGEFAAMVPPDAEGEDPYNAQALRMYSERRAAARAEFGEGLQAEQAESERRQAEGWTPPERPGPPARALDLTTIDFPVLAIAGQYDGFYSNTHRLWRELRNFQGIMLPQRGHLSSYYPGVMPDEYIEGIVTFINSHDDPSAAVGN